MHKYLTAALLMAAAAQSFAAVKVEAPWARATVQGQQASGAYMTLTSSGDATLVGVATPAAESAEVHEMKLESGVMKMRPAPRLPLPAGQSVTLRPGGYHVMLMGLKKPLHAGEQLPLKLKVQGADGKIETIEVKAEVRDAAAPADVHHH